MELTSFQKTTEAKIPEMNTFTVKSELRLKSNFTIYTWRPELSMLGFNTQFCLVSYDMLWSL